MCSSFYLLPGSASPTGQAGSLCRYDLGPPTKRGPTAKVSKDSLCYELVMLKTTPVGWGDGSMGKVLAMQMWRHWLTSPWPRSRQRCSMKFSHGYMGGGIKIIPDALSQVPAEWGGMEAEGTGRDEWNWKDKETCLKSI